MGFNSGFKGLMLSWDMTGLEAYFLCVFFILWNVARYNRTPL